MKTKLLPLIERCGYCDSRATTQTANRWPSCEPCRREIAREAVR